MLSGECLIGSFDHWCRQRWIRASGDGGSGHDREFPDSEVRIFRIMATLVTIGFKPANAAELARSAIDNGWNGSLRIFRGELQATGILSARGTSMGPGSTSGAV